MKWRFRSQISNIYKIPPFKNYKYNNNKFRVVYDGLWCNYCLGQNSGIYYHFFFESLSYNLYQG